MVKFPDRKTHDLVSIFGLELCLGLKGETLLTPLNCSMDAL